MKQRKIWQYFGKNLEVIWSRGSIQSIGKSILEAGEYSDHLEAEECGKSVEILWSSKEMWKLGNARRNF